jgi:hypothetical protein
LFWVHWAQRRIFISNQRPLASDVHSHLLSPQSAIVKTYTPLAPAPGHASIATIMTTGLPDRKDKRGPASQIRSTKRETRNKPQGPKSQYPKPPTSAPRDTRYQIRATKRIYASTHLRIHAFTHLPFYALTRLPIYAPTHSLFHVVSRYEIRDTNHGRSSGKFRWANSPKSWRAARS